MTEFDVEFESDILAKALKDTDYLKRASRVLDAHHFATPQHAWVWGALKEIWDKFHERATVRILVNRARADFAKQEDYQQCLEFVRKTYRRKPRASSATLEELSKFVRFVGAQAALEGAAKRLESGDLDGVYEQLRSALRRDTRPKDYVIEPWIEGFDERQRLRKYRRDHPEEIARVPTGLPTIDGILSGGLEVCEMGLLLATTGVGKSIGLMNFGYTAVGRGIPTLYATLEMPALQIAQRFDSRWLGMDYNKIKTYDYKPSELREIDNRLKKARSHFGEKLRIVEMPLGACTIGSLREVLEDLAASESFRPKLILVDSGDHMRSEQKYESFRLSQSAVYWDLAALAGEGYALWTSTHAGREYADAIATAEATGESYDKARIADLVLSLNTPAKKGRRTTIDGDDDDDDEETVAVAGPYKLEGHYMEAYLGKYRDGVSRATVPLDAQFSHMRLAEVKA